MLQGKALFKAVAESKETSAFWWLGQHSFVVKLGKTVVLIDPFLSKVEDRQVPPLFAPEDARGVVDLVLCTHDHLDHIDPAAIPGLVAETSADFVAPSAHVDRMQGLEVPSDRLTGLNDGESATIAGLTVHAVKAAHETFDQTPEGLFPFLGFVIEGQDKTVYHAGDTVWWEGLQQRLRQWSFDAAMVPINGRDAKRYADNVMGNMTYQEAVDLLGGLEVGLSVPTHYDMFTWNGEDPKRFEAYMHAKYPGRSVWIGEPTQQVTF